jgi:hypothetical protein
MKLISGCAGLCLFCLTTAITAEQVLSPLRDDTRFYIRLGSYLVGYNETKINISRRTCSVSTWISTMIWA